MYEQQLLTDLAVADKNVKEKIKYYKVSYDEEVRKSFSKYNIKTYFDLIRNDLKRALELRKLAINEKLI